MAAQAQQDALAAFNALAMKPYLPANDKTGAGLGGLTLTAGVYHFDSTASLSGNLTLDTQADANAVFVFQIGSTLNAVVGSAVLVTGAGAGVDPNVFWEVGSSATIETNAAFYGNVFAFASASLGTSASLANGRVIALNGAVTLLNNTITPPLSASPSVPEPSSWMGFAAALGGLALTALSNRKKTA